jgi:arginine utilization regulatory protein
MADGGTLFLDEVGELPAEMQVKLLRALQEKEFYRVGGTKTKKINVRIITATNRNLEKSVEEGTFRQDLFYRLNVVSLSIPPLRERPSDIMQLIHHFFESRRMDPILEEVKERLLSYSWPGNVRELNNTLEYFVLKANNETLSIHHLPVKLQQNRKMTGLTEKKSLRMILQDTEEAIINEALFQTDGNVMKAAKLLDIPRQTLQYKLSKIMENAK